MRLHFLMTVTAMSLLAACSRAPSSDQSTDGADAKTDGANIAVDERSAPARRALTITDQLGTFAGTVGQVAFWQNPNAPGSSRVLAGNGEAGLITVAVDRSAADEIVGNFGGGLAIAYTPTGTVIAAAEAQRGLVTFRVTPDGGITEIGASGASDVRSICFSSSDSTENFTGFAVSGDGTLRRMAARGGVATLGETLSGVTATSCVGLGGASLVLTAEGDTMVLSPEGEQIGFNEIGLVSGNAVDLAAFNTDIGPIVVYLLDDGRLEIDGERLSIDGLASGKAVRLAGGSGNFGGVYRDGVLGVVSDAGELGLIPWSALTTALDLDAPSLSAQEAGDSFGAAVLGARDLTSEELAEGEAFPAFDFEADDPAPFEAELGADLPAGDDATPQP